ncbi:MAG: DsbA family protein [Thermodesulfobacteriota bacterium]
MKVTVYYDYICPYCYIGSFRIESLSKELNLELEWKGMEIHPEIPPSGLRRKSNPKLDQTVKNIDEMAGEDGIEIKLPGFVTNSRLSLEAAEFAKTKGLFGDFHHAVYEAYFREGINIGDRKQLLKIAEGAGLSPAEVEETLEQRTMKSMIESNHREAEGNMILGVPTYVIGGYPLHGSQSTGTLRTIIERAIDRGGA